MYTDDTILSFGKYKFTRLCRVPPDYLLKFSIDKSHTDLHQYVVNNLEKIIMRMEGIVETPPFNFPCNKFFYACEKDAKQVLKKIIETDQEHKKPIRSYECEKCGGWHLTSKPLEEYKNNIRRNES